MIFRVVLVIHVVSICNRPNLPSELRVRAIAIFDKNERWISF